MGAKNLIPGDPIRPDVFSFQDYKVFLKNYFHFLKLTENFSLRKFASLAGVSIGYLPTILNSRKNISAKGVEKILPHLKLDRTEAAFFRKLCSISESSSPEQRMEGLRKLKRFEKFSKLNPSEALVSNYFSKWYNLAIREMANEPNFRPEPEWVQGQLRFSVPLSEITRSLEFLLNNKLILKTHDGYRASKGDLVCEGNIFRLILTHFYKQTFDLAGDAIDNIPREERNLQSYSTCLSTEEFQRAREIMDKAIQEISEIQTTAKAGASVYHFTSFAFPLATPRGKEK